MIKNSERRKQKRKEEEERKRRAAKWLANFIDAVAVSADGTEGPGRRRGGGGHRPAVGKAEEKDANWRQTSPSDQEQPKKEGKAGGSQVAPDPDRRRLGDQGAARRADELRPVHANVNKRFEAVIGSRRTGRQVARKGMFDDC